jgi:hypothetical protein
MFPHHVRDHVDADTDLLVNLTNDGWFGDKRRAMATPRQCCVAGRGIWPSPAPLLQQRHHLLVRCARAMREIFRDPNGSEYGVGFANWKIPFTSAQARTSTLYQSRRRSLRLDVRGRDRGTVALALQANRQSLRP